MNRALLLSILTLVAACGVIQTRAALSPRQDALDPLPPWNYAESAAVVTDSGTHCGTAPPRRGRPDAVRLLAWRIMEDTIVRDSARLTEEALWWARFTDGTGHHQWVLANAHRQRGAEPPAGPNWQLSFGCDLGNRPLRVYDRPPANGDVLDLIHWSWLEVPFNERLLQFGVRIRTWKTTIGAPPPPSFLHVPA